MEEKLQVTYNGYCDPDGKLMQTPETIDALKHFGALCWSEPDMATVFGISDYKWWALQWKDNSSWVYKAYWYGRLEMRANVEINALNDALHGHTAEYQELVRDKSFTLSKLDIFGGAESVEAWNTIREYIRTGKTERLSNQEKRYIDVLVLIYSMDGQYGKRKTIKFLTEEPFGFKYEQAARMYSESLEMFYCNRNVSTAALKAKTADQLESLYLAAVAAAKTAKDFEAAGNILAQRAKLLGLDQPEKQQLPAGAYQQRFTVVSLDPASIGLPAVDRNLLAAQIKQLEVPESVKERLKEDAGIIDMDIVKRFDDELSEAD